MVVCGASVDDVNHDGRVFYLEVLASLIQLPHADVERPGQSVHRVHVDAELGHGGLREVIDALSTRLFVGKTSFVILLILLC